MLFLSTDLTELAVFQVKRHVRVNEAVYQEAQVRLS